jgi:hypothetical protein
VWSRTPLFADEAYILTRVDATFATVDAAAAPAEADAATAAATPADPTDVDGGGGSSSGGGGGGGEGGRRGGSEGGGDLRERARQERQRTMEDYLDERVVMAYVYLDKRHELYGEWDYDAFRAQDLEVILYP